MNIEKTEALWTLGKMAPESLPAIAAEALELGFDGPALRELAGMNNPTRTSIESLFEKCLNEIGRKKITQTEAALQLSRIIAKEIVEGQIEPYEGARQIWTQIWNDHRELAHLATFAGLADGYEDEPYNRDQYARDIERAAMKLLTNI